MHKKSDTSAKRHRHLVVFPVFLGVLALGFADMQHVFPQTLASVTQILSTSSDERFTTASGVYGIVYEGGSIAEHQGSVELQEGSALIATETIATIAVRDIALTLWNGAAHVTRTTRGATVAALTAPVYVESGDRRVVVPAGMQWEYHHERDIAPLNAGFDAWMTARMPRLLPTSFVERTLREFSIVRVPEYVLPTPRNALPTSILPEEELLLPVSYNKALADRYEQTLGVVRRVVEAGDADAYTALLQNMFVQEAIHTERGKQVIAALLHVVPEENAALRMQLLELLLQQESLWMLAGFHAEYRELAWALFDPDVSAESHLTRAFLFPYALFGSDGFSPFLFERYAVTVRSLLDHVSNTEAFIEHLLDAHVSLIEQLYARGYPQRAKSLSALVLKMIDEVGQQTEDMRAAAMRIADFDRIDVSPLPEKVEPELSATDSVVEKEPEVVLTADQVEKAAHAMLTEAEALFTVNTAIAAFAPNEVRVSNVLFSTAAADRSVSFILNVITGKVRSIQIEGHNQEFPYEPQFRGFVQWMRS